MTGPSMIKQIQKGNPGIILCLKAVSSSRAVPLKTGHKLRKDRISDSAEHPTVRYSDVARSLRAAQGSPVQRDQVIDCPFWVPFWANKKEPNKIDFCIIYTFFFNLPCQSSAVSYADKRRSKKTAPQLCRPFRLPCASLCCRDGKKLASPQTVLPSYPGNSCRQI